MFTMLVVDDEYYLRLGFQDLFEWEKYGISIVGTACDGEEGLQMALQFKPDLIITDICMPFMNGLELMEKLKENQLDCSVIILSGFNEFEYAQKAIDNGALAYLLKPIDKNQLRGTIEKVLKQVKSERSTKQYYEILKSELSTIKEQFLRELISGKISDAESIKKRIATYDIPLELNNNAVVLIKMDDYELITQKISSEEQLSLKQEIESLVAKKMLLNSSFLGILVQMSADKWGVILHLMNAESNTVTNVKNACSDLAAALKEKYDTFNFSIGISNVFDEIDKTGAAYTQAAEAADTKFLPGINSVVYAGDNNMMGYRKEIREVIKYIRCNYYKDISVDSASRFLYISPSYLMHILRDELDKTFNECLTECRIEAAKELLKNPECKVCEISQEVGYKDVKYFSRIFKKETGVNPSDYVRLNV